MGIDDIVEREREGEDERKISSGTPRGVVGWNDFNEYPCIELYRLEILFIIGLGW